MTNTPCIGKRTAIAMRCRARSTTKSAPGDTVVANVSRTVIAAMRRAYANVVVVSITAPPNVLAERIAMRARSSDGKIEHRLRRTVEEASAAPDVTIVNTSSAEYHARQFVRDHQGRELGRVDEETGNVRCRDDRAARGDLRLSQRCLDGQGRGPGHAGLSGADGQIAVRGAGDLRAGGAGLLAARRSAGLRSHP